MPIPASSDSDAAAEAVLGLDEDEVEGEGEEDGMGETVVSVAATAAGTTLPGFLLFPLRLWMGGLIVFTGCLVSILVRWFDGARLVSFGIGLHRLCPVVSRGLGGLSVTLDVLSR
jgi:hypothetical protein